MLNDDLQRYLLHAWEVDETSYLIGIKELAIVSINKNGSSVDEALDEFKNTDLFEVNSRTRRLMK